MVVESYSCYHHRVQVNKVPKSQDRPKWDVYKYVLHYLSQGNDVVVRASIGCLSFSSRVQTLESNFYIFYNNKVLGKLSGSPKPELVQVILQFSRWKPVVHAIESSFSRKRILMVNRTD